MFTDTLTQLGLSKNEAQIFETLIRYGQCSVSTISKHTNIHRRNVYDTLNHLLEKGLVYEIFSGKENQYHAVQPNKLRERLKEKEQLLEEILPTLNTLYDSNPPLEAVYIYKGIEGWKNYLQDILDVGEPLYTLGGKGAWADKRLQPFLKFFLKEAAAKGITFHALYDGTEETIVKEIRDTTNNHYKFLPSQYQHNSVIDTFGNRVVIFSNIEHGKIDEKATLTVIVNKSIADSYRRWFQMIWDLLP